MSERKPPQEVEDYTNAFLWSLFPLLFMGFFTLAALTGFPAVMFVGVALHAGIMMLGRRLRRQRARA